MSAVDAGLSRQANRLFQAGHYFQAEQLFRRLAGQDPENWQFALMLGLCRHSQGDLNEALKWVGKSVELGDGQPATHYYLGRIHTDSGKPALAREQFAQAIALDPNHVEARTGMGIVSLGVGDFERAVTELKTALRARADHVPALAALARALVELERIEEAWPHAVRAVEVDANNPMVQDVFGRVLMRAGRLEEAERAFRKSLELNPARVEVHAELAGVLALQRRDREALEQFGRAMAGKFVHPRLVIDASISLERIGDLAQARNMLGEASKRWPNETALKLRLVEVEMLSGMTEQADARLAELDPESAEVILMKARIADAGGESSRAAELLEPLVEADVDDKVRDARLLLSSLRARLAPDQPEAAREPIAGLLDREVPVPDAALTWATVCEQTGQYDDACNVLEKLLEAEVLGEGDRAVLSHRLGNLHDLAGNRAQAWAGWSRGAWRPAPHAARVQAQQ
ncbi:MAG: tetratricopeptide repeat protein, partial [Wenzhouxiangellaceae bacterium]